MNVYFVKCKVLMCKEGLYRRTLVKMWWDVLIKKTIILSFFKKRTFFVQTKKKQINVWVWLGVWGRKTVKITTYFITKDEKLCNSFFLFFFLKCTLFLLSPSPYYFCCCFACSAWSIIKPLSYLMFLSSTLYFPQLSVNDCDKFYESEREQSAEKVEKVVKQWWN